MGIREASNQQKVLSELLETKQLNLENQVQLRLASLADIETYYTWVNDEEVRKFSTQNDQIPYEVHLKWFSSKLEDVNCLFYLFSMHDVPIGQVRFQFFEAEGFLIHYSIDRLYRSKGLGSIVLKMAINAFKESSLRQFKNVKIIGKVKSLNEASIKVFERLSFYFSGIEVLNGEEHRVYQYD